MQVLGLEDFGIYSIVAGLVTLFSFVNNSLSGASQRFYNYELGKNGVDGATNIYNASFRIHLLLGILVCLIAEFVGTWYIQNKMVMPFNRIGAATSIFHACVISLFFTMLSVPYSAAIMAHEKMDYYALTGVLDAILKLSIVYILTIIDYNKLIIYGWLFCLISIFDFFLYFLFAKKHFKEITFRGRTPFKIIISMLTFTSWGILGTMSALIREQGLNLVLNAFFGPVMNAARGIAAQVSNALNTFIQNIITPARPQIIQSYAIGDIERSFSICFAVSKYLFIFFYMISLPLIFSIDKILHIWLGENIPPNTGAFVIILLIANNICVLQNPLSAIIHAKGDLKFYQLTGSITNLSCIVFAYIFIILYPQPILVFSSVLISTILNVWFTFIAIKRKVDFSYRNYFFKVIYPIVKVISISLPIAYTITILTDEGYVRLVTETVISFTVVSSLVSLLIMNSDERLFVTYVLKKKFKKSNV